MNTDRIKQLAKKQGKTVTYICNLIDRPKYYLNDVAKAADREIPEKDLQTIAINLETTVAYLRGETDDPAFHLSSVGMNTLPVEEQGMRPVYGTASAGLGIIAEQQTLGYERVSPEHDTDEYFWLIVSGDSMSPVFTDKDLVLVQKDAPVESGSIMVIIVDDDDGFIKQVSVADDTITLHSFNPAYPPMVFGGSELSRLRFIGRVVEQKRKF